MRNAAGWALPMFALLGAAGCRDISRFSTLPGESYCGSIVDAPFVRRGLSAAMRMRLRFDADRVSIAPGTLSTNDGLLKEAPMRPLPELAHDPLLTFSFGEGRDRNFLFAVEPTDAAAGPTINAVLSLMHTGDAEVRLFRGAPPADPSIVPPTADGVPLFGVFAPLRRETGECSF